MRKLAALLLSLALVVPADAAWYNSEFLYRVSVTVQASQVDSDLENFPVYVDLSDLPAGFHTNVQASGADIRVTKADGTTEVPREVVWYSSTTDTGELHFNSSGTITSTGDTAFYIYYGSSTATEPAASSTYGSQNVWSNYHGVYHMQNTSGNLTDSTANARTLTVTGTPTYGATGKMGQAITFNGSDQAFSGGLTGSAYPVTLSVWGSAANAAANFAPISVGGGGSNNFVTLFYAGATAGDPIRAWVRTGGPSGSALSTAGFTANTYAYAVATFDSTTARSAYVDGGNKATNTATVAYPTVDTLAVGAAWAAGALTSWFNGTVDEARVANFAFSDAWADAEYTNQHTPDTFYTVGAQEEDTGGGETPVYRRRVIIH